MDRSRAPVRFGWKSRLTFLGVVLLALATLAPVPFPRAVALPQAAAAASLREYMNNRASATQFSGVVLVSRRDAILFREAYGMASYDLDRPNTVETVFRIGSLTKPVTAVAALRLAQRGRLGLDDAACARIAQCPTQWRSITIRHLLSHRSGLPDLFSRHAASPVETASAGFERILADLAERSSGDSLARLAFEPGSQYRYNNFNYVFLAYLMERATGRFWEDVLRMDVFEPAGMTSTGYDRVYEIVHGRARGYRIRDGKIQNTDYDDHEAYAAGGLLSTVDDLRRFVRAAIQGDLLDAAMRAQMLERGLGDYGLGWQIVDSYERTLYNHTGSIGGFSSYLGFYPVDELLVIVLSNVQDESARGTGCDLAGLAFGESIVGLDRRLEAPLARASEFDGDAFGRYLGVDDGATREIRPGDDGVVVYARGGSEFDLRVVAPDSIAVAASPESLIRLTRDSTGAVSGFEIERCGGVVTRARKVRSP